MKEEKIMNLFNLVLFISITILSSSITSIKVQYKNNNKENINTPKSQEQQQSFLPIQLCNQCQNTVLIYKAVEKLKCSNANSELCSVILVKIKENYQILELIKNNSLSPCNICFRLEFCHLDTCSKIENSIKDRLFNIFENQDFNFNLIYLQGNRDIKQLYSLFNILKNKSFLLLGEIKKLLVLLLELANIDEFQYISNKFIKFVSENSLKNSSHDDNSTDLIGANIKKYILQVLKLNEAVVSGFEKLIKEVNVIYSKLTQDSENNIIKLTKMLKLKLFKQYVNSLKKMRSKIKNLELLYEIIQKLIVSLYSELKKNTEIT